MPLKIGRGDIRNIEEHAKEAYPEECAGVLVGMNAGGTKIVVDVWRAENTHEGERERRFLIEPLKIKEFEERAEEREMEVLGFYHTTRIIRRNPRSTTGSMPGPGGPTS